MPCYFSASLHRPTTSALRKLSWIIVASLPMAATAGDLGWVTREQMQALPTDIQQPIPEWCNGTYFSPELAAPTDSDNTIIEADRSSYTQDGEASLSGNVVIRQPGRKMTADQATINQTTGDFTLDGDIKVTGVNESFTANHLTGNTKRQHNDLDQVRYSMYSQNAHGDATRVKRDGDITHITNGSYTTCEPSQDGWKLSANKIRLDKKKGWGTARHIKLKVKDIPILYLPWMNFPIDDRRKTGLLFPSFTRSSYGGFNYTQPIYLNLHPQLDMLVSPQFVSGRGAGIETKTRYLTRLGAGELNYARLKDDRKFDDKSRSMASWRHRGSYKNWSFGTDINYVSDDFYFKDLDVVTLDTVSKTQLPRSAYLRYNKNSWQLSTELQSWQVIDPNLARSNYPYRRLPRITLTGQPKINGPFRFDWVSEYTYFDQGAHIPLGSTNGSRFHVQPAVSLPLIKSYGYITPKARVYSTYYDLHGRKSLTEDSPRRSLIGASIDSGLFFERNFQLRDRHYIQTLEPRLFYNYVPYRDQSDLPLFDTVLPPFSYSSLFRENRFLGYDRIGDENKLAGGLTSRILDQETGAEIWRFRVGQGRYFKNRRITLDNNRTETSTTTPIVADATFQLNQHWSLYAEKQWSNGTDLGKQETFRFGYHNPARRYAYIGYRRMRTGNGSTRVRQAEIAGMWPISQHWSLLGSNLFDLDTHQSVATIAGVEYRNCCWKVRLVNRRLLANYDRTAEITPRTSLMFQVQLIGLGGFGDKIDSIMEDSIPGYRSLDQ